MIHNINFQASQDDYLLSKIYAYLPNFCTTFAAIEILDVDFLLLFQEIFGRYQVIESISYYHNKTTNNLEPYIERVLLVNDSQRPRFAVKYSITNMNEDSDTVNNFNYENNAIYVGCNFSLYYNYEQHELIQIAIIKMKKIIYEQKINNRFYTIGMGSNGFKLVAEKLSDIDDFNIKLHYGKKIISQLDELIQNLQTKYHGLFLLYGDPGTGKSYFIRYIIHLLCNEKTIIYVPAYMIEQLANPEFITFLQSHKESVLILEDAEFALQSRNDEIGAQAVSNLLNLTNGLLNDATKIQIIATFNMDKKNIDKALLRPGRLLGDIKFEKLSIEDSQQLAVFLQKNIEITVPMTVAEIYNGQSTIKKSKKRIGINDDESI